MDGDAAGPIAPQAGLPLGGGDFIAALASRGIIVFPTDEAILALPAR